jgi:lipopolysaccharide/colanic/teichoic acid biosynthesis glycosyltransferase
MGLLTQTKSGGNQREAGKAEEDYVEFLEAGEASTEALEVAEQSFNFIASLVHLAVRLPGFLACAHPVLIRSLGPVGYYLAWNESE